jgi:hypothetical protein
MFTSLAALGCANGDRVTLTAHPDPMLKPKAASVVFSPPKDFRVIVDTKPALDLSAALEKEATKNDTPAADLGPLASADAEGDGGLGQFQTMAEDGAGIPVREPDWSKMLESDGPGAVMQKLCGFKLSHAEKSPDGPAEKVAMGAKTLTELMTT